MKDDIHTELVYLDQLNRPILKEREVTTIGEMHNDIVMHYSNVRLKNLFLTIHTYDTML